MNRKVELSEKIKKSFIKAADKMSVEDKLSFYQALECEDDELIQGILKKYNYIIVTPVEQMMSNEHAENLAQSLLKNGTDVFNKINEIFDSSSKEFWSEKERMNHIPLDNHEEIIKHVHELQDSFNSKDDVNGVLHGVYGENTTTVIKAAIIADAIGCLDLRNDLMVLFNSMIDNAYNSNAMDTFKKKKIISEDRSLAKKGKTNSHHATALKIAADTWSKYPNASLAGLSDEIYAYLRPKRNGIPSAGTVYTWLKESGLNPDAKPKNRNFKLVLTEGA